MPLVPVTPMTVMSPSAGRRKKAALIRARAFRVSGTRMTWAPGASTGSSAMTAAAPAFAAWGAYLCPSAAEPRRQKKAQPGPAFRESYTRSVMSVSAKPSRMPRASSSRDSFICVPPELMLSIL